MEDIIRTILDVVRAQHSATEGTEEKPFDMEDVVDMAMGVMGRPDEEEEQAEMMNSIQKIVESLAPDLFPPKTFEEMDDTERAASAVNMIEQRLKNGFSGRTQKTTEPVSTEKTKPEEPAATAAAPVEAAAAVQEDVSESPSQEDTFDPQQTAELNDIIYKNLMEMMGAQTPQVEYPFDRSQIRYGKEKSVTEMLEEEKAAQKVAERSQPEQPTPKPAAPQSAWEIAQNAINQDEAAHQKEPYIPKPMEEPQTKTASQLAAEAIARSQEEDKMKSEIEKRAEALMAEAAKRGQDPMKFALHQQEILQYMEKNSDELVSFEDYEDLSPEEKYEIEQKLHIEKQLEAGVAPEDVDHAVPEEYIPKELLEKKKKEAQSQATSAQESTQSQEAVDRTENASVPPVFTEEMLRQLSQEVIRENSDMILADNAEEDMAGLNEAIFENIKKMMSGSGQEVPQEDVDDLIEQVVESNKGASAVDLAMAAQKAAMPEPKVQKEAKSAVELAKEAQEREQAKKKASEEQEDILQEEDLNLDELDDVFAQEEPDITESVEEDSTAEEIVEEEASANVETEEEAEEKRSANEEQETSQEENTKKEEQADIAETDVFDEESEEEDYEYVDPDEMVLGEHTQAEVDEAIANLASLGLEGDVYERAKRMLLLELAGSEAELDAWLKEQENGKKKKAAISALDGEETLEDLDGLDEDALEKELELAMDEDFMEELEEEETEEPEESELQEETEEPEESELQEESEEPEESELQEDSEEAYEEEFVETDSEEDTEEDDVVVTEEENEDSQEEVKEEPIPEHVIHANHRGSRRKKVVRKKERTASEENEKTEATPVEPKEAEKKEYQVSVRKPFVLKNSASFMTQFEEYIVDTQENRKLSTGFKKLDAMLRYGLHKGSYFIDAQPQYLKNSFMQQIADRAAEAGIDVLYISTELSRYDLMVETISRLSYEIHHGDTDKAVSVMSIMTGEDGADLASLNDELNWYRGRISEHLFIVDQEAVYDYLESTEETSAGNILSDLIRSIVREGAHKPVVFIDNIENILSTEDSEDMKPLMEGIRKLSRELGIPIIMSYGYAQAESEEELYPEEKEYHESLGNMCDVYLELEYADMITEDMVPLTEDDIRDMVEEGESLLLNVMLHKNRRPMKASCQIQCTPKYNFFEE